VSTSKSFSNEKFLIIAGTSKAGTTSVFNYLAKHPQICATDVKETRFFLDADYPLRSEMRYERDGAMAYLSFFPDAVEKSEGDWRLEATPDYLYSSGTAQRIRETLPNVRLIFLLREPVSRLLSFYRFGQAMGEVPQSMTFDEFVQQQREITDDGYEKRRRHPAFRALRHGCYSTYLRPFVELFGRSCIHIAFYEDLARAPLEVMKAVCRFSEIDEHYFDDYSFKVANKGVTVRNPLLHNVYWRAKQKIRSRLRCAPKVRSALRRIGARMDALYEHTNVGRDKVSMSRSTEESVRTYYNEEPTRLRELLGLEVPWPASLPVSGSQE
jgi:hypothetical protein